MYPTAKEQLRQTWLTSRKGRQFWWYWYSKSHLLPKRFNLYFALCQQYIYFLFQYSMCCAIQCIIPCTNTLRVAPNNLSILWTILYALCQIVHLFLIPMHCALCQIIHLFFVSIRCALRRTIHLFIVSIRYALCQKIHLLPTLMPYLSCHTSICLCFLRDLLQVYRTDWPTLTQHLHWAPGDSGPASVRIPSLCWSMCPSLLHTQNTLK